MKHKLYLYNTIIYEYMGATDLRNIVQGYINTADERLLSVLKAVAESYRDNDIVAYTVEGLPVTRKEYRQELLDAEIEVKQGQRLPNKIDI